MAFGKPARRPDFAPARPVFEPLETRRFLSVSLVKAEGGEGHGKATDTGGVTFETSKADVEGTRKADTITIDVNQTTGLLEFTINGVVKGSVNPLSVAGGIEVESHGGNDTITIGAAVTAPVDIDADKGNDTVVGGSGNDVIKGGPGKDNVNGGAGDDILSGEQGNDSVAGGAGKDYLDGGVGKDNCSGGDDDDTVLGAQGSDVLTGELGDDRLRGGAGKDNCDGGDGNDDIDGGSGRDTDTGGPGTDDFNETSNSDRRGRLQDDITDQAEDEHDDADNIDAAAVPPAVTAAFNARYPGATINEIEKETEDAGDVYKFDFNAGKVRMRALFRPDGTFMNDEVK
jgi:Ca2+-binding RTX toxin-like protein